MDRSSLIVVVILIVIPIALFTGMARPFVAASRGFVDEVIQPRHTRAKLIDALARLSTKRDRNPPKKHGNIPL